MKTPAADDGAPKYLTSDCAGCPYFIRGRDAVKLLEVFDFAEKYRPTAEEHRAFCIFGVAIRTLVTRKQRRVTACALRDRSSRAAADWMAVVALPVFSPQEALFMDVEP